jgi:opacity protein-like surface antigen
LLGVAAVAGSFTISSVARAECSNTFPGGFPVAAFLPFGQGGGVNSLVSVINTVNTAFLTNTTAFVSSPGGPMPDQQGGGAWGRVIAGTVDTDSTGVTTIPNFFGAPVTGSQVCNSTTRQDYSGFQVGQDFSILNGGGSGANWHWGVTAGYFAADAKDVSSAPPVPTFTGDIEVPFFGIYTAFTKGNFFFDAQARWDYYQMQLNDPANTIVDQSFNARGYALTANVGYTIPLHNNWFIEPSAGIVWSKVKVDELNVAGPLGFFPGTVQIQDIDSLLGRLSLSVGTNLRTGMVTWQPYATASVVHEFADDVTTTLTGFNLPIDGVLVTSRIGTYGQFALGTAAVLGNTGLLGYVRGDYRIGENVEGWSVNAGLRYQFNPGPGRRSIKDDGGPAIYAYNWTGPYLGGFAGATWGGQDWFTAALGTSDHPDFAGYLAGGQVGYNVQLGRVVVGVEGDYGFANAHGGRSCDDLGGPAAFFFTCEAELSRLATITGRVGHTWGRALFYVKGGVAFGETTVQTRENTGLAVPPSGTALNGETKWLTGWTAGLGMEFAISDHWSGRAEYMHYDLGSASYNIDNFFVADAETQGNTVRIGLNYHFHRVAEPRPFK